MCACIHTCIHTMQASMHPCKYVTHNTPHTQIVTFIVLQQSTYASIHTHTSHFHSCTAKCLHTHTHKHTHCVFVQRSVYTSTYTHTHCMFTAPQQSSFIRRIQVRVPSSGGYKCVFACIKALANFDFVEFYQKMRYVYACVYFEMRLRYV